jgi:hypothetical protein
VALGGRSSGRCQHPAGMQLLLQPPGRSCVVKHPPSVPKRSGRDVRGQSLECQTCGGGGGNPLRTTTVPPDPGGAISNPIVVSVSYSSNGSVTDQGSVVIRSTGTTPLLISDLTYVETKLDSWSASGTCYPQQPA